MTEEFTTMRREGGGWWALVTSEGGLCCVHKIHTTYHNQVMYKGSYIPFHPRLHEHMEALQKSLI